MCTPIPSYTLFYTAGIQCQAPPRISLQDKDLHDSPVWAPGESRAAPVKCLTLRDLHCRGR